MDLAPLIVAEGGRASACGRVVTSGGEVWFDPPLPVAAPYYPPGQEPAPGPSGLGILVEGVDLARLNRRREKDGAVEGTACLTGVWRDGRLTVTEQRSSAARRPEQPLPKWTVPPCNPPEHGWPVGPVDANLDVEDELDGPEVVTITMFRPSSRQVVAVIASDDPDRTRRRLSVALGDRLCVIKSKWTRQQVRQLRAHLDAHAHEWLFYAWGEGSDEGGQVQMHVELVRVLPSFAEFATQVPDGLMVVDPWLAPVGGEGTDG